ncbi:MAG: hypothetical protein Tsb0019_35420 [Roseibium sp.]
MNRDLIIAALRAHQDELRSLGVKSLALFGSVARGQTRPGSDIDIAAVYDDSIVHDLMGMGGVAAEIASCLGTDDFDLANEANLSPHIRGQFMREHVRIF